MGFIYTLLKVAASLIGLVLTLAGVGGFFYVIFLLLTGEDVGIGVGVVVGGIVAASIGTILGQFAGGDYD